ncbi:MAG TPA: gas vesicle protein GvpJ, partial [Gemmatimonadaceae bacterium]|nr:gas vesicle protein GvpJ [Gemmatimonadaceae bacterium]
MSIDDLLGTPRVELAEVLSHVLDKGVVLRGEVMLAVADIDLIKLDLGLLLTAVETATRYALAAGREADLGLSTPGSTRGIAPASGSTMESQVVESLPAPKDAPVTPLQTVAEALPPRLNTD